MGAALGAGAAPAAAAEEAHRDLRDRVTALLVDREAEPVGAEGGYALPFPVLSEVDAATLAVVLEDGVAAAWVRVLDQAAERSTRELAVTALGDAEVRAVAGGPPPADPRDDAVPRPARGADPAGGDGGPSAQRAEEGVRDPDGDAAGLAALHQDGEGDVPLRSAAAGSP